LAFLAERDFPFIGRKNAEWFGGMAKKQYLCSNLYEVNDYRPRLPLYQSINHKKLDVYEN